jgi:hypothetical protein
VTATGLWLAVVFSGAYHGLNPAMGWPLAVSAAMMSGSRRALFAALGLLALGHLAAMAVVLAPFTLLVSLVRWQRAIRIGVALAVIAFGLLLLVRRRHPRIIARIRPTQLALWSFAVATAHGAALMLVPIFLGLCRVKGLDGGHQAAGALIQGNLLSALAVAAVHTLAMLVAGGAVAFLVQAWLGLRFLKRGWLNLDALWASSLVAVGAASLAFVFVGAP